MRSKHTTNIEIEILSSLFDAGVISVVAVWLSNTSLLNGHFFFKVEPKREHPDVDSLSVAADPVRG